MTTETTRPDLLGRAIDAVTDTAVTRRRFLGAMAGTLVVALTITDKRSIAAALGATQPPTGVDPTGTPIGGWVTVGPDGTVTVLYGGAEMGQGSSTGLSQAVAEELGAKWSDVTFQSAPLGGGWTTGVPWFTGGSSGIRWHLDDMRKAGAQAREMLKAAAADPAFWNLPDTSTLIAADSTIKDTATGLTLTFAQLAPLAATKPVPADPPILRSGQFVGVSMPRLDIPSKTNGSAKFGIDTRIDGMVYAVVKNSPVLGGTLKATPKVPTGATAVVNLGNACAVVAGNTWAAIQAAAQLQATWVNPATAASMTSATILSTAQTLLTSGTPILADGDPTAASAALGPTPTIDRTYYLPYLAHIPMEVPNATVKPTYGPTGALTTIDVWVPTQAPTTLQAAISGLGATLVPAGTVVNIHTTLLGGGFGRKFEIDYAIQAVRTALGIRKAVKVIWPREEDVSHDQYRPMALSRVRATLDANHNIVGWSNRIVTPSILTQKGWIPSGYLDSTSCETATIATGVPYVTAGPTHHVEVVNHPSAVWVGFWRSVGASINTFVVESAIDELAGLAGQDEYLFRRQLLLGSADPRAPRFLAVLDAVAALGTWTTAAPAGHFRGIALSTCFDSVVGEVVEVSAPTAGAVTVHKVAVVIDCGMVVNPNAVEAQAQGAVVMALGAAQWGQVTFTSGKANQKNFSNYRVLRSREMPVVSTQIIKSAGVPTGGVGEVSVPGIAPALVSAYAKATGTARVRTLPMFPGATMTG